MSWKYFLFPYAKLTILHLRLHYCRQKADGSRIASAPSISPLRRTEDYKKLISFDQYFNVLTFFGNQTTALTDMPANSRHLDTTFVNLTLSHKEFFTTGIGAERSCDAIKMSATARGLTLKEMKSNPGVMTNINVNSPRKLGDTMAYGATQMSDYGTPDRRGLNVGRTASIVNGNLTIYAKTGVGHPDQISRFNSANTPASQ